MLIDIHVHTCRQRHPKLTRPVGSRFPTPERLIGRHAMAGVADGNMNHTQSSTAIEYCKLNDKPIGEIAQFALYQGALGLPMIFLSGDERVDSQTLRFRGDDIREIIYR